MADRASKKFRDEAAKEIKDAFRKQIQDMVLFMPKQELSNLAESLVNLTSTKRRVSAEKESVGGPIDVAVISKGDGFVWVRRKHYFDPNFNPRYFARQLGLPRGLHLGGAADATKS
jgi:hypothetical protein